MRWSKLKSRLDELRASSLVGRLELHSTRYRSAHDDAGRAWITFDGVEVLEFSDLRFEREYYALAYEVREMNDPNGKSYGSLLSAYDEARAVTTARGNLARFDFAALIVQFLELSIEQAIASPHPLIRAFAVMDRRVGKRRLATLANQSRNEHVFVHTLLELRCSSEGIPFPRERAGGDGARAVRA